MIRWVKHLPWPKGLIANISWEMIKQIERQIRDLQKELSEIQREQASLRLQPCQGDTEIRKKEEKLEDLDKRIKAVNETIRELDRKRQELMSESLKKSGYESPFAWSSLQVGGWANAPGFPVGFTVKEILL